MFERVCLNCGDEFTTSKVKGEFCFWCTLQGVTGGELPEEGDFNTACILSGTMTDQEKGWLRSELEAVEGGLTTEEESYCYYGRDADEDDYTDEDCD